MKPKSSSTFRTIIEIRPQLGPQEQFLSSSADIVFYGGSAGGGKTWALLMEAVRHVQTHKGFGATIFRRTTPEIKNEGALWDTAYKLYPYLKGRPRETDLSWRFPPHGNRIQFSHMEHESDKENYQGAQIAFIAFDELTHFTYGQFNYLLSRNRSLCGIRPYIRATCNPDADSWVAEWIDWYIGEDGYIIPERSGVVRWFVRIDDTVLWGNSREELVEMYGEESQPISFTFIRATLDDNKILVDTDPGYRAKLNALPLVERERLLYGNWKIKPAAGMYFRREWFEIVDHAPACTRSLRWWDCAATEASKGKDPDWSIGLRMGELNGVYYIMDVQRFRKSPGDSDEHMRLQAVIDGKEVAIREEHEPGSSGKKIISVHSRGIFQGYDYRGIPSSKSKITRAMPFSAACQNGNVKLVRGLWNNDYLVELEGFPERAHDDQVDASSGAFNELLLVHKPVQPRFGGSVGVVGGTRI